MCFCNDLILYSLHGNVLDFVKPGARRLQPARAWFLKIVSVQMSVCVCPPPRLFITSGVIWTPCDWLNKFYSCYMATVVVIVDGRGPWNWYAL